MGEESQRPHRATVSVVGGSVYRIQSMSSAPMEPIIMYSTTWCPDCRRAKAFLKDRGIEVREVNIEDDPDAEDLVLRVNNGRRKVPTLQVGDRFFACSPFNAGKLASELNLPLNI
jgi:glutaredoxin